MVINVTTKNDFLNEGLIQRIKDRKSKNNNKSNNSSKKKNIEDGKITKIDVTSPNASIFNKLYNNEALTAEGCSIDSDDTLQALNKWFREMNNCNSKDIHLFYISSKAMNDFYHLTGDNKYPDNFHIVCIDWIEEGVSNPYKGNWRWFSDVVDNNARREIAKKNPHYKHYKSIYYGNCGWGD